MTTWYNKYKDFPYLHLGNNAETGIDCFNLCKLVYLNELNIDIPYTSDHFCKIIDEAMQVFGATGISQWTPLARMYAGQRTLRLADGPDEVHWHVVGRAELARYEGDNQPTTTYERGGMFSGPA